MEMSVMSANVTWGTVTCLLCFLLGLLLVQWDVFVGNAVSDPIEVEANVKPPVSSVWCRGDSRRTRFCRFKNLCYNPLVNEYVFFHGPETVMAGLPARDNLSDFYVADLTSVDELNVHYLSWTDVPSDAAHGFGIRYHRGVTLLAKRFKPDNLMHVIHDDLLPLFATLQEYCAGTDPACFRRVRLAFLDHLDEERFVDLYRLLGNPQILLSKELDDSSVHCFDEAIGGLNKDTTWYEYGYRMPQRPMKRPASGETIVRFARHILSKLGSEHASCGQKEPYAVLLSRTSNRLVLNEPQVMRAVVRETSLKLVKVTDLRSEVIRSVLSTVACAEMLIGMHGAALILAVFMRPGKKLLEMFPYAVPSTDYAPYRTLAAIPGVDLVYAAWENTLVENTRTHPDNVPELGGLKHLSGPEQNKIKGSQRVRKHLCCDDPEWLFRIYQDTIVDEVSFRRVLRRIHRKEANGSHYRFPLLPRLHPGVVRQASCERFSVTEYLVQWQQPWNLQFMSPNETHYEIWIQQVGSDSIRSVLTRQATYSITLQNVTAIYNCWIRCVVDRKVGNKQWISCQ